MDSLYLIALVAQQRFAIAAASIESVVEIDSVTPVPMAPPQVAGLSALRSRVLTVIDSYAALGEGKAKVERRCPAVVVTVDGHLYGLLVDRVEEVVHLAGEPQRLHGTVSAAWRRVSPGLLEHEGGPVLILDPAALVAPTPALAA